MMQVKWDAVKKSVKRLGTTERKHWRKGLDALKQADSPLFDGVKKVRSQPGCYELRPVNRTNIRIIFECSGDQLNIIDVWKKNGTDVTRRYS